MRPRFRLRTMMIIIAFVALILTVITQSFWLRQAAVRAEVNRAMAEQQRLEAELRFRQAQAAFERAERQLREIAPK